MSLCRVCLQDGASYPIFGAAEPDKSVQEMLSKCFKEEIEDIDGYPRSICLQCKRTLDTVWDFIVKFRESQKLLEEGVFHLKQEHINNESDIEPDNNNHFSEVEIEIKPFKDEPESLFDNVEVLKGAESFIKLLEPKVKKKIKKEVKEKKPQKKTNNKYKGSTDRVASSILEGEFTWTGEKWCLKSTQIKTPKENLSKGKRRDTRLKLPRKTKTPQQKLCDLCGDVFKTQYKLSLHRKKFHFKSEVKCPQCPKICSSEYNLKCHVKRKHTDSREFMCATCGHSFAFRAELTNHTRRIHSGLCKKKTFACKFCDKTYKCAKSVLVHERSVHTGERPAECTICMKGFFHEEYLKEHMRLHTGEAPFKCPVCGRGYAQRCNMKSHLRIHRISEIDPATLSKIKPNYLKLLKA